ncbi:hypothetical protein OH76DRAFT_1395891 [Lentinus brumalis]|uniref:Autophagy-related protein 2 n=1 Tax=Lentinus brumalis TaxID=2498619 RepID=A0A371DW36_9APHY|nr:hypothetical protein OH76DRAFT_1395891 [Polyporus brumalis]
MLPSFSWLPSLPAIDFSLPSSIQKRFISFALRQSLGHFLKPGQLDVQQVDSQIGSGYVQVRDLELNNEAINSLISGLPIRLHDGSVGKVTARIPWPNPLTSSVGLSLESLHLTFYLEPTVALHSERQFVDNLADSVASVAETFIHEELTPNEEATLRESMHPDHGVSQSSVFEDNVPGGLDPFISEEDVHFNEADPPGVSIFATLIERLLARFEFDATDTKITIVNPQQASFTVIVPHLRYETVSPDSAPRAADTSAPASSDARPVGETRKVTITGVTVTTRCLRPLSPQSWSPPAAVSLPKSATASPTVSLPKSATASPTVSVREVPDTPWRTTTPQPASPDVVSPATPPPASPSPMVPPAPSSPELSSRDDSAPPVEIEPSSPYSDSSDLDEETQLFMSQSIAALPPRPASPASSVASSMYQSAISATEPDTALDDIPEEEPAHSRSPTPDDAGEATSVSSFRPLEEISSGVSGSPVQSSQVDPMPSAPQSPPNSSQRPRAVRTREIEDETVLSLGSEPIELRLTTPPPFRPNPAPAAPRTASTSAQQGRAKVEAGGPRQDKVRIELTIGVVACAFSGRQIRSVIEAADMWASHSAPPAPAQGPGQSSIPSSPIPFDDVEGGLRIRGFVVLLLPNIRTSGSSPDDALTDYFSRPLVPPQLPQGYTRVHLEGLSASLTMKRSGDSSKSSKRASLRPEPPSTFATFTMSELSAFAFVPSTGSKAEMTASPILMTDPNLPTQYSMPHVHPSLPSPSSSLPTFDLSDWTDPTQRSASAKLSLWRTKSVQQSARPQSQLVSDDLRQASPGPASPPRRAVDLPKMSSSPAGRPIPVALPSSPGRLGLAGLSSSPGKGLQGPSKPSAPALSIKFRSARPKEGRDVPEVHVSLAPLHIFVDTGTILGRKWDGGKSEVLQFLDEVTAGRGGDKAGAMDEADPDEYSHDNNLDEEYRPSTPRGPALQGFPDRDTDQERERRRLEQLVLEDLDLGYDYRGQGQSNVPPTPTSRRSVRKRRPQPKGPAISVILPALRVEIRTPPPADRSPRAGAVVFDIHDLRLTPGASPEQEVTPTARFGTAEELYGTDIPNQRPAGQDNVLLGAAWKRIVLAYSIVGESKARSILSIGSLSHRESDLNPHFGFGTPPARESASQSLRPQLIVRKTPTAPDPQVTSTTVSIDLPSVHVELSKPLLDGLQLWADDLTQLAESAFAEPAESDAGTQRAGSDSSLIGSRYFARASTVGSGTESGGPSLANTIRGRQDARSETAVKVAVTEAVLSLLVPREDGGHVAVRPFDIAASDVDVLLELKPEGKDETVVTVGVTDLNVYDTTVSDRNCFVSLTTPPSLSTSGRSALKLRFTSLIVPGTTAKESRIRLTVSGITYNFFPDIGWAADLDRFFKAPPGAFESVVPSERTRVHVKIHDTSVRLYAPTHKGALLPYIGELELSTVIEGNSPTMSLNLSLPAFSLLLIDDLSTNAEETGTSARANFASGVGFWKSAGYAVVTELSDLVLTFTQDGSVQPPDSRLLVDQGNIRLHMCADTMSALGAFIGDLSSAFKPPAAESFEPKTKREPANVSQKAVSSRGLLASLDEQAFRRLPEVGAAPDMIDDDLPTNPDYLDEHFGAAAGLRELSDDEFDESDPDSPSVVPDVETPAGVTSAFGGETIRMLRPDGIHVVENYFDTLPPDPGEAASFGDTTFQVRVRSFSATVLLYDGYDWTRTRKIIEEKAKEMRRRLAKIRQLVASGQTPDPSVDETNTLLFNSVYIGLEHNIDELEPGALIAAIDEELNEEFETNTQSSWQSLKPQPLASPGRGSSHATARHRRRLHRSKGPSIEIKLMGLDAEVDQYRPQAALVSRVFATVKDVEILDHIKTSTWSKFLTSLRADTQGNVRETDSNMVRVELRMLHPVPGHPSQEARLRAKILPLRLHVDQDALDFLKQFFAFKDPDAAPPASSDSTDEIYFQQAEVFPVDIKLDYKPRRVDYRALREGRTIELMNFFHFDGAEMTLRHITVKGITGWPRFFDLLNDMWTPDVKATQLVDVISGVAPIRSVVNVGSGVADLILLPIAQYKKDGRVYHGLQKGTNAFMKSTAMEAIRLGARLATGTQVILEQAETVLGGQFNDEVMAEAVQFPTDLDHGDEDEDPGDLISKYAEQPVNVKEGMQSAYRSLRRNFNSAAQTILAVPMEVYERSGNEGAMRAVVRAVPIAVLKPMIGATEAVSKTLLGLQNTLDPNIRQENEAKYKQR